MTETAIDDADVKAFMDQVRASGVLGRSARRDALLEHLLLSEVKGEGDRLKGYSIGLDVLGKGEDFDPSQDSIVRVEMGRLRDALLLFEASDHARNVIEVEIPRGTYRPVMRRRQEPTAPPTEATAAPPQAPPARPARGRWRIAALALTLAALGVGLWFAIRPDPAVQVGISVDVTQGAQVLSQADAEIIGQYILRLRAALARNEAIRVIDHAANGRPPRYTVRPTLIGLDRSMSLAVELVANDGNRLIWAQATPLAPDALDASLDRAVTQAVQGLTPQLISSTKRSLAARDPATLNAWELYLLSTWVPGAAISTLAWEVERRDFARRATALDPALGQAHSVLADKLVYLSSVDADYHSDAIVAEARDHARRALSLAPSDVNVLFNLGIHSWHLGDMAEAARTMERVLEIDPGNGFAQLLATVFPYTCSAAPDSIVALAQAFDASLSPENPIRWVTLTWLGMLHLNRGELDEAQAAEAGAATIFRTPDTVMRHAVILHALGRTDEAKRALDAMEGDWPNLRAAHFAEVTMPRRCHEDAAAGPLLDAYRDLANALN